MRSVSGLLLLTIASNCAVRRCAQPRPTIKVGETAIVHSSVVGVHLARPGRREPTFINLDKFSSDQTLTGLIWAMAGVGPGGIANASGETPCSAGAVTRRNLMPEILAQSPAAITSRAGVRLKALWLERGGGAG